jgi:4-hydroxybenzoate polyprenyltransferase
VIATPETTSRTPPLAAEVPMRRPVLRLLRPSQWLKNAFVLGPWIFTGSFASMEKTVDVLIAFVAFCVASSANYVFNDLQDLEDDRRHPQKRRSRPLAAGALAPATAWQVLAVLWAALAVVLALRPELLLVMALYIGLNAAYSMRLKHYPVIDLFALAASFLLRVYAGGVALGVPVSFWMFVTTLSVALYLAALKRRQELLAGIEGRPVLGSYTPDLLDDYAMLAAASAFVFYGQFVYTVRPALLPTVPVVLLGFFRYRWLVEARGQGESPTDTFLGDPPLVATALVWLGWCVWVMWSA